jgi:hypothetical protein
MVRIRFENICYFVGMNVLRAVAMRVLCLVATCLMLIPCSAYIHNLEVKATNSTKTLADFRRTTKRYIAGDTTRHSSIYFP